MSLQFKWLGEPGEETPLPTKAHDSDIGYDLITYKFVKPEIVNIYKDYYAREIGIGCRYTFGYGVKFPLGYYGMIFPRSSIGKTPFSLANSVGIIDPDYRGELQVIVRNHLNYIPAAQGENYYENMNEYSNKLFQLVLFPIVPNFTTRLCTDDEWNETVRGEGGFGSTNPSLVGTNVNPSLVSSDIPLVSGSDTPPSSYSSTNLPENITSSSFVDFVYIQDKKIPFNGFNNSIHL